MQTTHMATPVLEVAHLEKVYGALGNVTRALNDVSFTVNRGEFVGIMGASGSGKSTMLRCINRLEHPTSGSIVVEGVDVCAKGVDLNKVRTHLGMVFQQFNLYPNMTVLGNLTLAPIKLQKKSKEEATEIAVAALKRVGMAHKAGEYPQNLSGGQQQRLCIARAVAVHPQVLLMDEPCSALDPISTLAVEDLIIELKNEYTIVIVTHNMQQAARIAAYTAFFNLKAVGQPGHLEYFTDTTTMFNNPQNEEAERYVSGRFG